MLLDCNGSNLDKITNQNHYKFSDTESNNSESGDSLIKYFYYNESMSFLKMFYSLFILIY